MAAKTSIEWTETTWNPVRGCSRVSPGCQNCYAERLAARFSGPGKPFDGIAKMTPNGPRWTGELVCLEDALAEPLRWKKPRIVFVNSMSDLFHEGVPFDFVLRSFEIMRGAHWHTFQILTKRSQRLAKICDFLPWPKNVWIGVSVESVDYVHRIDDLRSACAHVKFLSLEPLLGPLPNLNLDGIHWVIVGGESGPGARAMDPIWVTDIRDHYTRVGVPFFFKQWGKLKNNPDRQDPTAKCNGGTAKGGRLLEGRTWNEMPLVEPRRQKQAVNTFSRSRKLGQRTLS